jgi:hypothetical protein
MGDLKVSLHISVQHQALSSLAQSSVICLVPVLASSFVTDF